MKKSFLLMLSGVLMMSGGFVSCGEDPVEPAVKNTLSVSPSNDIEFVASNNTSVELTVTTDADGWSFTKTPSWVTAVKSEDGKKLIVNAQTNSTGDDRYGRVQITAGTADAVTVNIVQAAEGEGGGDDPVPVGQVTGSLEDESGESLVRYEMDDATIGTSVTFTLKNTSEEDVEATVYFDEAYLAEYNYRNGTDYELFPKDLVTAGNFTIAAGSTTSGEIDVTIEFDADDVEYGYTYLIPLYVKANSANLKSTSDCRVNYVVKRKSQKAIKNIIYLEVNDVNPLSILEWKIEGGEYYFDVVILFAANINWNPDEGKVYLNNNPNVQAVLDGTDTYIQPLRKRGIKVILGLLGNHDIAGLCQLTPYGSQMFAAECAEAVKYYKLDGLNFDDEWSIPPVANDWIASSRNASNGSRLVYESKKAMRAILPEEQTNTSVFYYGSFSENGMGTVDGVSPSNYVDIGVADYGSSAGRVSGDTDNSKCTGMSVSLGEGRGTATETSGRNAKNSGYGYFAWFNLNADPTHGNYNLYGTDNALSKIKAVCKGQYDKELITPTGYYKKTGQGQFDPTRYEY